jgi:hypothetical protein
MMPVRKRLAAPTLALLLAPPLAAQEANRNVRFGLPGPAKPEPSSREAYLIARSQYVLSYNAEKRIPKMPGAAAGGKRRGDRGRGRGCGRLRGRAGPQARAAEPGYTHRCLNCGEIKAEHAYEADDDFGRLTCRGCGGRVLVQGPAARER